MVVKLIIIVVMKGDDGAKCRLKEEEEEKKKKRHTQIRHICNIQASDLRLAGCAKLHSDCFLKSRERSGTKRGLGLDK